jgi:hypothetical protein
MTSSESVSFANDKVSIQAKLSKCQRQTEKTDKGLKKGEREQRLPKTSQGPGSHQSYYIPVLVWKQQIFSFIKTRVVTAAASVPEATDHHQ